MATFYSGIRNPRRPTLPCNDLRDWIKLLDKSGELRRIREEVSPLLEIAEITDRVSKSGFAGNSKVAPGGPALLFENIKGHPGARVLINQFGSERRMKLALGLDPDKGSLDEIAARIRALLEIKSPEGLLEKLKMLPQLAAIGNVFPKTCLLYTSRCV